MFADLTEMTRQQIVEQMNIPQNSLKLSLEKGYKQVRTELGWNEASILERVLIEQVALAWLRHGWIEYQYQNRQGQSITLTKAEFWDKKLLSSQRRLLRAVESLAKVRKLAARTPEILQVNIGQQQQVNNLNG